jgi:hypothetical protein
MPLRSDRSELWRLDDPTVFSMRMLVRMLKVILIVIIVIGLMSANNHHYICLPDTIVKAFHLKECGPLLPRRAVKDATQSRLYRDL